MFTEKTSWDEANRMGVKARSSRMSIVCSPGCRGSAPAKSQCGFISTLAFIASHEACCRMAVFAIQVTGIRTRPASRGTRRATAVTPQPSGMSLYAPARKRAVRGAGAVPLKKANVRSYPRWPLLRAMRPVAEWRSLLCKQQESTPDPRAARPVAERR